MHHILNIRLIFRDFGMFSIVGYFAGTRQDKSYRNEGIARGWKPALVTESFPLDHSRECIP